MPVDRSYVAENDAERERLVRDGLLVEPFFSGPNAHPRVVVEAEIPSGHDQPARQGAAVAEPRSMAIEASFKYSIS
jgi:hypothetical protein